MSGILLLALLVPAQASTHTVCASGCRFSNLQTAILEAQPGDTLVLKAGETYPGPIHLVWKPGESYITIESSQAAQLPPPGQRVTPAHVARMATIQQQHPNEAALIAGVPEYTARSIDAAGDRILFDQTRYLSPGSPIACRAYAMPAPLLPEQTYYVQDVSGNSVRLARSPGGPPIDLQGTDFGGLFRCTSILAPHHYRFRGIEFVSVDGKTSEYNLVQIGSGEETSRQGLPHHIEFLQVYIHGRSSRTAWQNGPRNCLVLNGSHLKVRDSYIAECKKESEESKAIAAWQAPGPLEIVNNYLEAASINILFGGARPAIYNHVVGDGDGQGRGGGVVISGNHVTKQIYWKYSAGAGQPSAPAGACQPGTPRLDTRSGQLYVCHGDGKSWVAQTCAEGEYFRRTDVPQNCAGGACWVCSSSGVFQRVDAPFRPYGYLSKNLFEAKSLMNARITGNVFETDWSGALSPAAQVNNGFHWNRAENVDFRNNIVRNSAQGIRLATEGVQGFTAPNRKVRVINNLFYGIGNTITPSLRSPEGRPVSFGGECSGCVFEHNTVLSGLSSSSGLMFDTGPLTGFRLANNILHANLYGIIGDGKGSDCEAILPYVGNAAFANNVLINNTKNRPNGSVGPCAKNTRYIDAATPLFAEGSFRLRPDSPYSAACSRRCDFAATTGKDLGADIEEIEEATSGAIAGTPPWSEQLRLRVTPSATGASIAYRAPDDQPCRILLFTNAARTQVHPDTRTPESQSDTRPGTVSQGRDRDFRAGAVAALKSGAEYWFALRCGPRLIPGFFQTLR